MDSWATPRLVLPGGTSAAEGGAVPQWNEAFHIKDSYLRGSFDARNTCGAIEPGYSATSGNLGGS